MALRAVIFDIDGVLADSRKAVVHNTKKLLQEFGFPAPEGVVEGMSSAHSAQSVLLALVPHLSHDRELMDKMLRRLAELTQENMHLVGPTPLVARVPELAKRYKLAAASNRKASAKTVLGKLGILQYFSAVLTSSDAPPKPDPAMIMIALQRLGVKPEEAVFVGDNAEDRAAGEAAGVRAILSTCESEEECERLVREIG